MIAQRSRTPVPQSLSYLIDDLARRHGALRTGTASAYLRCEDEALLARVLVRPQRRARCNCAGSRRRSSSRLRRSTEVLDVLREAGYAPAAESPDGEVIALGAEAAARAVAAGRCGSCARAPTPVATWPSW